MGTFINVSTSAFYWPNCSALIAPHVKFWTYGCTPIYVNGALDQGVYQFQIDFFDALLEMIYQADGMTSRGVWERLGERLEKAIGGLLQSPEPTWPTPGDSPLTPAAVEADLPENNNGDEEAELAMFDDVGFDLLDPGQSDAANAFPAKEPHLTSGQFASASGSKSMATHAPPNISSASRIKPTATLSSNNQLATPSSPAPVQTIQSPIQPPVPPPAEAHKSDTTAALIGGKPPAPAAATCSDRHAAEPDWPEGTSSATRVGSVPSPQSLAVQATPASPLAVCLPALLLERGEPTLDTNQPGRPPPRPQRSPEAREQTHEKPPARPQHSLRVIEVTQESAQPQEKPPPLLQRSRPPSSSSQVSTPPPQSHSQIRPDATASPRRTARHVMNANAREVEKAKGGAAPKGKQNKKRKRNGNVRANAKGDGADMEQPENGHGAESRDATGGRGADRQNLGGLPGDNRGVAKTRKVGGMLPPLLAAFPKTPVPPPFDVQDAIEDILEPNWEADSEGGDDAMDVDQPSSPSDWHSRRRQVMEIRVPTPRVNPTTGLVELVPEEFQYPYRAKVC
jgi:hypothetical protein